MTHSNMLTPNSIVQWDPEQITTEIAGEVVAMSTRKGIYIGLDSVASQIWRKLSSPQRIDSVYAQMAREYQGDAATIAGDVHEVLSQLCELGMLTVIEEPAEAQPA